ncbi:MAG: hypothetical protein ACUVRD_06020 [Bacteroidia bacterium]
MRSWFCILWLSVGWGQGLQKVSFPSRLNLLWLPIGQPTSELWFIWRHPPYQARAAYALGHMMYLPQFFSLRTSLLEKQAQAYSIFFYVHATPFWTAVGIQVPDSFLKEGIQWLYDVVQTIPTQDEKLYAWVQHQYHQAHLWTPYEGFLQEALSIAYGYKEEAFPAQENLLQHLLRYVCPSNSLLLLFSRQPVKKWKPYFHAWNAWRLNCEGYAVVPALRDTSWEVYNVHPSTGWGLKVEGLRGDVYTRLWAMAARLALYSTCEFTFRGDCACQVQALPQQVHNLCRQNPHTDSLQQEAFFRALHAEMYHNPRKFLPLWVATAFYPGQEGVACGRWVSPEPDTFSVEKFYWHKPARDTFIPPGQSLSLRQITDKVIEDQLFMYLTSTSLNLVIEGYFRGGWLENWHRRKVAYQLTAFRKKLIARRIAPGRIRMVLRRARYPAQTNTIQLLWVKPLSG